MSNVRVRFAPSPTGYLHIGGVRTALFNWLWAKKTGGKFILRIEDTDQERSTPESRAIILESMKWLGMDWDEGPEVGGDFGPYTQMERLNLYKACAERLIAEGKAYRCYCTREDLDAQRAALKEKDPKAMFKYPGTCRDRKDHPHDNYVVRLKTSPEGAITYQDKVFGKIVTPNVENQDFILVRSDGVPLYNFGAVVDDMTMGINLVARGRDHMINTPPQILLYKAFGAQVPEFAHLPMMLNRAGAKLSKRDGAVGVFEYRDLGYSPNAVLNYLARFGWGHGNQEIFSLKELIEAFNWEACGRNDGKFDEKKFAAIQFEHIKQERLTSNEEYAHRTIPFMYARGLGNLNHKHVEETLHTIREKAKTFVDAADMLDFFFRQDITVDNVAAEKFLTAETKTKLEGIYAVISAVKEWNETTIRNDITNWLNESKITMKEVGQSVRVAVTGKTTSPELFQTIHMLGKTKTLHRLQPHIR